MFYRLKAEMWTWHRLSVTCVNQPDNAYLHPEDFDDLFQEIELDPPWRYCRMFRAPLVDEKRRACDFQFNKRKRFPRLPEFWAEGTDAIVSEKVRQVIEDFDDFGHQFHPAAFLDHEGRVVNETPYYHLTVRRILKIEELGLPFQEVDFTPFASREGKYLSTVQHTPDLRENIETLPLWRHQRPMEVIYMNAAMVARLREAKVTGMDERTTKYGQREECLGHV